MKVYITAVASLIYILTLTYNVNCENTVQTKWIVQKLDNFNAADPRTWMMRYMVTEKYFKPGQPMFIYLGNENAIAAPYIENGLLSDLAREHNGILFHTEHRYYGKSLPTNDLSMKNLRYLSAMQALADLAHFIRTQRAEDYRLANSKVFIAGCSYAGNLVVWFKRLYPDLVDGAWAISAPIQAKVDFKEYYEVVGTAIKTLGSKQCYKRIKNGIAELERMFLSKRAAKEAKYISRLCKYFDYTNKADLWVLFRAIGELFADLVVFPRKSNDISTACDYLMRQRNDLQAIVSYFTENVKSSSPSCIDISHYSDVYHYSKKYYSESISRPWLYQMCNELGYFQSSASQNQPFGNIHPVLKDLKLCQEVFGSNYTSEYIHYLISETNRIYGGKNPNVRNVYTTHCSSDPWSALGQEKSEFVSIVPECSHCSHIYSIQQTDSPAMVASKKRVVELARQWLT